MAPGRCNATPLIVVNRLWRCVMTKIESALIVGVVALLVMAPPAAAQQKTQAAVALQKKPLAAPQASKRPVTAKSHRLILQVNSNEPAMMNLALNNATNVVQYYKDLGEKVSIEVVTFGPGLHMLRDDTSPVKARIEALSLSSPEISFKACGNTRENMSKAESKEVPLISEAKIVGRPSRIRQRSRRGRRLTRHMTVYGYARVNTDGQSLGTASRFVFPTAASLSRAFLALAFPVGRIRASLEQCCAPNVAPLAAPPPPVSLRLKPARAVPSSPDNLKGKATSRPQPRSQT
jgi:uncharacterized protein